MNILAYCNNNLVNMEDSGGNRLLYSSTGDPKEEQKAQQAAGSIIIHRVKIPLIKITAILPKMKVIIRIQNPIFRKILPFLTTERNTPRHMMLNMK